MKVPLESSLRDPPFRVKGLFVTVFNFFTPSSRLTALRRLAAIERFDLIDHIRLLVVSQFGVNRQREDFFGGLFRGREISSPMFEEGIAFLQMKRKRVIDIRTDSLFVQERPEFISLLDINDILMEDVTVRELDCR